MLSRYALMLLSSALSSAALAATPSLEKTIHTYAAAWQTADEAQRASLIKQVWDKTAEYTDPTVQFNGVRALNQHIGKFLQQFPGARTEIVGNIDSHHQRLRFRWKISASDGSLIAEGQDFGELAANGKLKRITGFFEAAVAAAK